jgi:hypothetical protein
MEKPAKTGKIEASYGKSPPSDEPRTAATYADGTPFDRVQYLEAKLILKPDRFTSVQNFRDFGKIVQQAANQVGVGFIEDKKASLRPEMNGQF